VAFSVIFTLLNMGLSKDAAVDVRIIEGAPRDPSRDAVTSAAPLNVKDVKREHERRKAEPS